MEIIVPQFQAIRKKVSLTQGRAQLLSPEGDVLWEDPDWMPNALANEGESSVINVYLREQSHPSGKYLGLLNDSGIAETDTLATMVESVTPGTNGYNRQQILAADWSAPADSGDGDMQSSAAEKTFGPASGSAWTCTHAFLGTVLTGTGGLFLLYVSLSATTTVAVGQSLKFVLRWKNS
jgi:hypothetical protein